MLVVLLVVLIEASVLMILLKTYSNEDLEFLTAAIVAFVAAIGTNILTVFLVSGMGVAGVLLAAIIAAVALGIAISALFGAEIKRSFLVAGIFVLVHFGLSTFFSVLFH